MKHLPTLYIILMPYLIFAELFLGMSIISGDNMSGVVFIFLLLLSGLFCLIGVGCCIACNIISLSSMSEMQSAVRNIVIKICHIPAHIAVLLIAAGFLNPFLMLFTWIPLLCGAGLYVYSGGANVCTCMKLVTKKKISFGGAIVLGVMSFVGILDLIAAVIELVKAGKDYVSGTGNAL